MEPEVSETILDHATSPAEYSSKMPLSASSCEGEHPPFVHAGSPAVLLIPPEPFLHIVSIGEGDRDREVGAAEPVVEAP